MFRNAPWRGRSFFWNVKNIANFYLLIPLMLTLLAFEAILELHPLNVYFLSFLLEAPTVLIGFVLLLSARKLDIVNAEQQPARHLRAWEKVRMLKIGVRGAAILLILEYYLAGDKIITGGNPLLTILFSIGELYIIELYLMIFPLLFWSPSSSNLSRLHLASLLEQNANGVKVLMKALSWLSKASTKAIEQRLLPRAFVDVGKLNHEGIRNLGLRLQFAVQRNDYEAAIQAIVASTGNVRGDIVTGTRTAREVVEEAIPYLKFLAYLLILGILLLAFAGRIPVVISP